MADESISKFYAENMHELSTVVHGLQIAINYLEIERLKLPLTSASQTNMRTMQRNMKSHMEIVIQRIGELSQYDTIEDPRQQSGQAA